MAMTEEEILQRLERGEDVPEDELDRAIGGSTPQGRNPIAGAPRAGVAQWETRYKSEPTPQPTLGDIAEQALIGAGGRLTSYAYGIPGVASESERKELGDTISQMRKELPFSSTGEMVADVAVGTAMPVARGASMMSRAARTTPFTAGQGVLTERGTGGSGSDQLRAGAVGALTGAGGSLAADLGAKGVNAVRGKWTDPQLKYLRDYAEKELGVPLRPGDLFPDSAVRGAENLGAQHPFLSDQAKKLSGQSEALNRAIYEGGENKLINHISNTKAQLDQANQNLWAPVYQEAAQAGGVGSYNLRNTLISGLQKYPRILDRISNEQVKQTLSKIVGNGKANSFAPSLSFQEVRELQQSLGPITDQLTRAAQTGAAERGEASFINGLYGATKKDLNRWGMDPQNAGAYQKYTEANDIYKRELLPFYSNPIVRSIESGDYYHQPESLIRDILSPMHKTQIDELEWYLAQTNREGTGLLKTVRMADRGARKLTQREPEPNIRVGVGAALAPKLFAGQLLGAQAVESPFLSAIMGAAPDLGPRALQGSVRGGLGQISQRRTEPRGSRP